ncbi:hypothetical protein BKP35_12185 [Anaerobacillus arseniciselenatis]|uniref:Uncharacterized protein n=2 Tax=Anaerobacillus arseniciselenatis TaxID=85682 RepID=A0A1S2LJ61_9BACI|nr:hypothetical protein BKP35_12185 [Anaerobacillus arseniciselenatis]
MLSFFESESPSMEKVITKDNLELTIEKLCIGDTKAQHYNREYYSRGELSIAIATTETIKLFIEKMLKQDTAQWPC